ncbi:glycoside hydrolase family 3 N-terminal domain-containing protein [Arundinibacter roseus]|uniref:beta-N-acetylhexosaminidase n=1 Tax=Arundinibacter roseus TaxID=2070510 RepID=A0A4R4KE96_9BACT|nr:glycoside hydrolase family 3 N-terminal domain-containing protein [Arundinibacter roseus]TDB66033.1 glycoside hydrolase [Arundinibacter roseus]
MKNWFDLGPRLYIVRVLVGIVLLIVVTSVVAIGWKGKEALPFYYPTKQPEEPVKVVKKRPKAVVKQLPLEVLPESDWADSTLRTLTLDEKIGQFFMVATFSNRDESYYRIVDRLVTDYKLGGLIFFQGGPYRQAVLTNRYQALAKVPLFIGIDGEWGLGMRLDSTISFPKQMVLGAIRDETLVYRMGDLIGQHCRRMGIHINFAPVSDINSNPDNPVIGFRSFGEDRDNVTQKAVAYMKGLQRNRVIATAKHFPGHGDTDADSHYTLPVVSHSSDQLREIDLYPYKRLIADSLMGVLTGHLYVPVLDNTPQLATSLSEKVVTQLLQNQMGFKGLIFTDAMNMRGVLKTGKASEVNLKALLAGNDILLYPESIAETIQRIKEAVEQGVITEEFIDKKVHKILRGKYWAGLNAYQPIVLPNLYQDLNGEESRELSRELSEASVTVIKNEKSLLPFASLEGVHVASVTVGAGVGTPFQKMMNRYAPVKQFVFEDKPNGEQEISEMMQHLAPYETVVVGVHGISNSPKRRHGISNGTAAFVARLKAEGKKVVLCLFGTPYSIRFFPPTDALICANEDNETTQQVASQIMFGALPARGMLPVSVAGYHPGTFVETSVVDRMSYGTPESVGMNANMLRNIDHVVAEAIDQHVFPGCQVVVARKGKVVYSKGFGNLTYRTTERVTTETLYDVASVTKVSATLQAVMWLYDKKKLDLEQKASFYLPELKGTNKQHITVRELLQHRSGMVSFYPKLWSRTMTGGGGLLPEYYSSQADSSYYLQVAPKLFARPMLRDSVWKWIVESPLTNRRDRSGQNTFVYSDLGFLTLQKIVERLTAQPLDIFVWKTFYEPMGLSSLGYNPLRRFPSSRIAPTEQDYRFRGQLLQGTVHDQMAAVMGGVSGHAGLFGTATDLAMLMQMNLWKGKYGGKTFFQPSTVPTFSRLYDEAHHRGLGWEKVLTSGTSSYVSDKASANSFGHTGFTGAIVWADPDEDLVFVFLSNRVHPDPENKGITTHRTRRKLHDIIYQSLLHS